MRRIFWATGLILSMTFFAALCSYADSNVINGCYKKNNGQLRILTGTKNCRPSELPISWNTAVTSGIATSTFSGVIDTIGANSSQFAFAGTTLNITTSDTQRITGAAQAPLGTSTSGSATFNYDLCYRTAGTTDTLKNFSGTNASLGAVSNTAGRLSFTAASSVVPGAGTWEVGYCVWNSGTVDLNDNDYVSGWVIVTNE